MEVATGWQSGWSFRELQLKMKNSRSTEGMSYHHARLELNRKLACRVGIGPTLRSSRSNYSIDWSQAVCRHFRSMPWRSTSTEITIPLGFEGSSTNPSSPLSGPPNIRTCRPRLSSGTTVAASMFIIGILSYDFVLRFLIRSDEHVKDIAISNTSQIAIVLIAMVLGGLSTNRFVAGLSLPWASDTQQKQQAESRRCRARIRLESLFQQLEDSLRFCLTLSAPPMR